jgi:hypothetical protein
MYHGKQDQLEQVQFSGNAILLIDLKKEIVEKKKMSNSLDFDLKIVDDSGKGFQFISTLLIHFLPILMHSL